MTLPAVMKTRLLSTTCWSCCPVVRWSATTLVTCMRTCCASRDS
jgi:hypothetical protein